MEIGKEELLRINKGFGGELRNSSSFEYALDIQKNKKLGIYKKLSYLMRAILVDHPFTDGNKRTAAYIALKFANECNKEVDRESLLHHIIAIAKDNITDIRQIEWRMKNAIK